MPSIYIVAGNSGSGKSTIVSRLQAKYSNIYRTVSVTTRTPRKDERFGIDYYFVDENIFSWLLETGQLLEYTEYEYQKHATIKFALDELLNNGHDVIMNLDKKGIEAVSKLYPNVRIVFLRFANLEDQERRLSQRGMNREEIARRIATADEETRWAEENSIPVITTNDDVDRTLAAVEQVLFKS